MLTLLRIEAPILYLIITKLTLCLVASLFVLFASSFLYIRYKDWEEQHNGK